MLYRYPHSINWWLSIMFLVQAPVTTRISKYLTMRIFIREAVGQHLSGNNGTSRIISRVLTYSIITYPSSQISKFIWFSQERVQLSSTHPNLSQPKQLRTTQIRNFNKIQRNLPCLSCDELSGSSYSIPEASSLT